MKTITITIDTAATIARNMRETMDLVYDGELSETAATRRLNRAFDQVLPHYQALFEVDTWAAEQVANAAEWLDRLDDLPEEI